MNRRQLLALIICILTVITASAQPKREFRGAWIQCVNGQYLNKSMQQVRTMLSAQLDTLQKAGINAILFQVRAEGDALYKSSYEPWSRYLTGRQGQAPADGWDPLAWMVDQCHQRGMECHAWINPYRAKTKYTTELGANHAAIRHPERIFEYDGLYIFNPALESNRMYTCMVVEDILQHYDVDGLHMDDYFYPYPVKGLQMPDEEYFLRDPRGFKDINDWRRDNVNLLIRDLYRIVRATKPWVKFGISPFGIYRNSKTGTNTPEGSATSGTQNYDDLYADVLEWERKGWIDYCLPQIYWNFGTKAADYEVLCHWWNDYCNKRPLFIGQDVERTVKEADPNNPQSHQMYAKYNLQRSLPNVQGSCQWYAAAVVNNPGNYRTVLEQVYHHYPALQPEMKFMDSKAPGKPRSVKLDLKNGVFGITWKAPKAKKEMDRAVQYVVYRFAPGQKIDLKSAMNIEYISPRYDEHSAEFMYPKSSIVPGETYVVTALDHLHNESKGVKIKIK